jgi:hypothetical protein
MNKLAKYVVILCVCGALAQSSEHHERKITSDQAKALALAALTPAQKHLPGLETVRYQSRHSSRFVFYTVVWLGEQNGSVVVENFAVDSRTGDVWSASASCDEMNNPELSKLQSEVRVELGLSGTKYKSLKTHGPLCEK